MIVNTKFNVEETPLVILADGCLGSASTKIVTGLTRFGRWPIVAGIDSSKKGMTFKDVLGYGEPIPIVGSLQETLKYNPKALLIGIAVQGGELPVEWREILIEAINNGLGIINGLHYFLAEDEEIHRLAQEKNVVLWDVRSPSDENQVAKFLPRPSKPKVILTVGSDCSCGKMYTSLELAKRIPNSKFLATGQTGILISGSGIPLDRIIGDFMAGAAENLVLSNISKDLDWLFVEGQGSLIHPSFSGVTMALMHGTLPDGMILCHNADKTNLKHFDIKIPSLNKLIAIYEEAMSFVKPSKIIGISLNCSNLNSDETDKIIYEIESSTGLPVIDPVKTGVTKMYTKLNEVFKKHEAGV